MPLDRVHQPRAARPLRDQVVPPAGRHACRRPARPASRAAIGLTPRKSYSSQPSRPSSARARLHGRDVERHNRIEYSGRRSRGAARTPVGPRVISRLPPVARLTHWERRSGAGLRCARQRPSFIIDEACRQCAASAACTAAAGRTRRCRADLSRRRAPSCVRSGSSRRPRGPCDRRAQAPQPAAPALRRPAAAGSAPPPVTFRVEVNYVEVDAIVTDEHGNIVKRPHEGRFPDPRGRQAAEGRAVLARRHPGRARRQPLFAAAGRTRRADERAAVRGAPLRDRPRRPATAASPLAAGQEGGEALHRQVHRRQRPRRRRAPSRPHRRGQEFTSSKRLLDDADRPVHGTEAALGDAERIDDYNRSATADGHDGRRRPAPPEDHRFRATSNAATTRARRSTR